ncbi:MAG: hypothetical protein HYR55_07630 [Acidobacteria bacterium]|nr:hypothetical protein [Acidobacteriota bacterium]MBI3658294.1 hypothetical protein [Acidobacteriota bacterium]
MIYRLAVATLLPVIVYVLVGLSRKSRAQNIDEYFVYGKTVSTMDYANTSVGYALQMAAIFLFAYWGARFGIGGLWTPLFWMLGFGLLYKLLPKFMSYHTKSGTMHEFLAQTFGAGPSLQFIAALATIFGLWGTMMAEIDYTLQIYAPFLTRPLFQYILGAAFLIFGVSYIVAYGFKAEVNTERVQVPVAYACLIAVLILTVPSVWLNGNPKSYTVTVTLLATTLVLMIVAKVRINMPKPFTDRQVFIPILGLIGLFFVHEWLSKHFLAMQGHNATILNAPLREQFRAQGLLTLVSLFLANALWMPVDLSTWQRIASVHKGNNDDDLLNRLRRGTWRVMLESPASWCLGVVLGLIIQGGGFLKPGQDASEGLTAFASVLASQGVSTPAAWLSSWLYPIFVAACVAIMLSTVDSIISAIAFTACKDLPPYRTMTSIRSARVWTVVIMLVGLVVYPILRQTLGANLQTILYTAYSCQLSLVVVTILALYQRRLDKRAAILSVVLGLVATGLSGYFATKSSNPDIGVLPPIFAIVGAAAGYLIGIRPTIPVVARSSTT